MVRVRSLEIVWLTSEATERIVYRSRALPECDLQEVRSLKAFIAYDSIASPDHPLSVGKGGAELYLGTTPSFTLRFDTPHREPGFLNDL